MRHRQLESNVEILQGDHRRHHRNHIFHTKLLKEEYSLEEVVSQNIFKYSCPGIYGVCMGETQHPNLHEFQHLLLKSYFMEFNFHEIQHFFQIMNIGDPQRDTGERVTLSQVGMDICISHYTYHRYYYLCSSQHKLQLYQFCY